MTQSVAIVNPAMLKWAREWRGRSIEEVAHRLKKEPEKIEEWEKGASFPTAKQARSLADFYDRPFVEFFLDEPPKLQEPESVVDYRMHRDAEQDTHNWELKEARRWAEEIRDSYIFLRNELGYADKELPPKLFSNLEEDEEIVAERVRELLGFSIHQQLSMRKADMIYLPNLLRDALDKIGILALKRSEILKFRVRGICLFHQKVPVIVYTAEAPTAQAFTIAHELGHVCLQLSGVTGFRSKENLENKIERWCDRFAAAFLMPRTQVTALIGPPPDQPASSISDETIERMADIFRVSRHAMTIRLVALRYVSAQYYWEIKFPQFREEERNFKSRARPRYYGTRYKNAVGDGYTGLVIEAWRSGNITNHNAAEFLGIKNFSHLYDIQRDMVA